MTLSFGRHQRGSIRCQYVDFFRHMMPPFCLCCLVVTGCKPTPDKFKSFPRLGNDSACQYRLEKPIGASLSMCLCSITHPKMLCVEPIAYRLRHKPPLQNPLGFKWWVIDSYYAGIRPASGNTFLDTEKNFVPPAVWNFS